MIAKTLGKLVLQVGGIAVSQLISLFCATAAGETLTEGYDYMKYKYNKAEKEEVEKEAEKED